MGQIFARANGDPIVAIARNAEKDVAEVVEDAPGDEEAADASRDPSDLVPTDLGADEPVTDVPATDDTNETQEP
jgi:hypothetical protein